MQFCYSEEEETEDANRQIKPNKNDKNLFLREIDIQRLPDKEAYNEAAINEIENWGNNDDAEEDSSTRLKFEEELDESLADVRQRILARRKNRYRVLIKYCVFSNFFLFRPLSYSPLCQCVFSMAGQTPALQQQNWQSSEKSKHFKEKHNI